MPGPGHCDCAMQGRWHSCPGEGWPGGWQGDWAGGGGQTVLVWEAGAGRPAVLNRRGLLFPDTFPSVSSLSAPLPAPTTPSPLREREAFDSKGLAGCGMGSGAEPRGSTAFSCLVLPCPLSTLPPPAVLCCWQCCPQPALCRPLLATWFHRARLEIMLFRSLGLLWGDGVFAEYG